MSTPVTEEPASGEMSPDAGAAAELAGLSPEEAEARREEWRKELAAIEEDIQALRSVLAKRVKDAQDVKRKLGVSVWKEFTEDVSHGLRTAKESNVYQKTESVVKATAEKTTSILGGLGMGISQKLGQLKNSESFRSLEEKMGSAYENVKTKVSTSRSSSIVSFDGALRDGDRKSSTATTPTIPEARTPPS